MKEETSLLGGEGVRARTSTAFRYTKDDDAAAAVEAFVTLVFTAPEAGDSDRLATPPARDAAAPVRGGDGVLERGTDSTTFKVEDILTTTMMQRMMKMQVCCADPDNADAA